MADQITWSADEIGDAAIEEYIDRLRADFADLHEPLSRVADHIDLMIIEEFETEGARSGGWLPLSADYVLWKERYDPGSKILELDPALLGSRDHGTPNLDYIFFPMTDRINSWDIGLHEAVFEPDSTRAAWHQEGVDHPRGRGGPLPERPILFFTEMDYVEIGQILDDWVHGVIIH